MADVIYSIAQGFDIAYDPAKARIEVAIAVTARPFLETYKGFRILDDNRLEVYVNYWHFQEGFIASYASPAGLAMPWAVLAAMDDLVFTQRRAAYSDTAASRFNVPWLSLVMDKDVGLVKRTLRAFIQNQAVPEGFLRVGDRTLAAPADAVARYNAALKWSDTTGNLVIGNGPFFLSRYDPAAQYAELRAFRDPGYPFKPGDWWLGDPPTLSIGAVAAIALTAGQAMQVTVPVQGTGRMGLRFLLVDSAKRAVAASGEAAASASGFVVTVPAAATSKLAAGLYELALVAYSDSIAQVANRSVDVNVKR
jgi:peptide/nickel transport system substrate-binding protein